MVMERRVVPGMRVMNAELDDWETLRWSIITAYTAAASRM